MPAPKTRERLAVRVEALTKQGYSAAKIAEKLGVSERTVKRYRAQGKRDGTGMVYELPEPKSNEDLHPDVQALTRFHPDAFEAFFNRYSDYKYERGERKGERSPLQAHSKRFLELALGQEQVVINVPPRHAKSAIFSVWLPIWLIARSRDVQILLLSKTQSLALKFLREICTHLERNERLIADFGKFKPEQGEGLWSPALGQIEVAGRNKQSLSGDVTILARGALQQVYGFGAHWLIADDVVDVQNTLTLDRREKLSDWFHTEVITRLEPDGRAVVVGTRFHLDDLYGELAAKRVVDSNEDSPPLWTHVNFPAVTDWDRGEVLWPERWPVDELRKVYNKIGAARFAQTYQQDPVPAEERLVDPDWIYGDETRAIPGCVDRNRVVGDGVSGEDWVRVISLDPSPSRFASMMVADVRSDRDKFESVIIEVVRRKMGVREMLSELTRIGALYHPSYLVVEVNAAQKWFLQDQEFKLWSQANDIRVIPHTTGRNKSDPEYGIQSLATDFEFGRIRLPYGDWASQQNCKVLIDEATTYPYGTTDDVLMSLWFLRVNHHRFIPRMEGRSTGRGFKVPPRLQKRGFRGLRKTA